MPGLAQRNEQFSYGSSPANGFWSKHRDDVSFNQLQKFWNELSPQARQELLRIDKQTLFEQARKNMYCSRCNGLLLEGFLQIVMYGKSLQEEGVGRQILRPGALRDQNDADSGVVDGYQDEIPDPAVHPWGGLTTTREGSLTLMDCYLYTKSLKGLQNVFDSARARERERELLYPDACGGGGRGWVSQGMVGYGRGHGTRETCALHTARLSCDTLVDFWSALGDETRQSLLRMKEEDFIERLMYRFDSKRFCRDCRRNVIREFKELKELKRMRREPRCTSWFCVADTAFDYEVSDDTIHADWHNTFADAAGTYHHFEWGVGTGEGKTDILEFENVGMNGSVKVDGLDLSGLSACFITVRACKLDGRYTDLCVKAHALKSGQCVHCRLVVGDGFVTITRGESIRRFFEHAEEAEEEEDDDSMDKDGNDLDGECSRPQKHAKSPELAREFLLDAATVIFKEQVEKAFREGTARQNAHSIFVCLALKLLEERVHVACKEIITLEKQMKLLEEEEKEKREEEERKERRRAKEREKKLRRKERLKGKEKDKDKNSCGENQSPDLPEIPEEESSSLVVVEDSTNSIVSCSNLVGEAGEKVPYMPETQNSSNDFHDGRFGKRYANDSFTATKYSRRRPKGVSLEVFLKWSERRRIAIASGRADSDDLLELRCPDDNEETTPDAVSLTNKQLRVNGTKLNSRSGPKFCEKFHCSGNGRTNERYDFNHCSCNQNTEYRPKAEIHVSAVKVVQETKSENKSESDITRYNQTDQIRDNCGRPKSKFVPGSNPSARDHLQSKKVWEPLESQKKYPRSNSESDVTLKKPSLLVVEVAEPNNCITTSSDDLKEISKSTRESNSTGQNGIHIGDDSFSSVNFITSTSDGSSDPVVSLSSSSDNCSSCLSEEGDSNTTSSNLGNNDSSSTSDSEDSSLQSEGKETLDPVRNGVSECHKVGIEKHTSPTGGEQLGVRTSPGLSQPCTGMNAFGIQPTKGFNSGFNLGSQHQSVVSSLHSQTLPFPVFQQPPSTMGYYHQNPVSWPAPPFSHPNHYLYTGPLGYSMTGDSHFCLQYNPMQHLATTPLYAPGPIPYYHPIAEQTRIVNQHAPKQQEAANNVATEESTDRIGLRSTQAASSGGVQSEDPGKARASDTGFSLFHWGGPVALSNPLPPTEETVGRFSTKCSIDNGGEDNNPGSFSKETAVEEYNLFAASNGIRFSFF